MTQRTGTACGQTCLPNVGPVSKPVGVSAYEPPPSQSRRPREPDAGHDGSRSAARRPAGLVGRNASPNHQGREPYLQINFQLAITTQLVGSITYSVAPKILKIKLHSCISLVIFCS